MGRVGRTWASFECSAATGQPVGVLEATQLEAIATTCVEVRRGWMPFLAVLQGRC